MGLTTLINMHGHATVAYPGQAYFARPDGFSIGAPMMKGVGSGGICIFAMGLHTFASDVALRHKPNLDPPARNETACSDEVARSLTLARWQMDIEHA